MKGKVLAVFLLGLLAAPAHAGSGSGTVGLSVTLTSACSINSSGGTLGELNFGKVKPTWTGALAAQAVATVSLECSDGVTSVDVSIDGGLRGDRTLAPVACNSITGAACSNIPYKVFRDSARTVEYEISVAQVFDLPSVTVLGEAVSLEIPLYGAIAPGSASSWGEHTDTLTVSLDFNN